MIAYFDLISGISGDMTLGALVDMGVPVPHLKEQLSPVLTGFEIEAKQVFKNHLSATDIDIRVTEDPSVSRNYKDIRSMIETAPLKDGVKANSLAAFERIARVEAAIHGKDIDTVHFHEIGGVDSIVDIIGSFLAVDYLGIKTIVASPVPLGSGSVKCAHGNMPVPVPATIAILKGIPITASDAKTEIVTPTGAAIIAVLASSFGPVPEMKVKQVGYGAGKRETGSSLPNLLRVILGEERSGPVRNDDPDLQNEKILVVKTNIDDMSPEGLGFLMADLFEKKALDVTFIPVQMKKNRPGIQVEVICRHPDLEPVVRLILSSTSSIGVRYREWDRIFLNRRIETVSTRFGNIAVKTILRPGGRVERVPEYDVAAKIAREKGLVFRTVYSQIQADAN